MQSLVYLILVELTEIFTTRAHVSDNILVVPVLSFFMLMINNLSLSVFSHQSIQLNLVLILWEVVLSLPIYISLRFWEERFIVKDIKLRV